MDRDIKAYFLQMAQDVTIQTRVFTTHDLAMTTQANQGEVPQENQQVINMVSYLRYFTRMNPPTFYGSKFEEDPQEFIDEIYRILYARVDY